MESLRCRKGHIVCGCIDFWNYEYLSTGKWIYLELDELLNPLSREEPSYHGYKWSTDKNLTLVLDPNNDDVAMVQNVVWMDGKLANAVMFHTRVGFISQTCEISIDGTESMVFQGGDGRRLVGVYGRFGEVMDTIGYSFAPVVPVDQGNKVDISLVSNEVPVKESNV